MLPYKHVSRSLKTFSACTVLSHGSIMLPPPSLASSLGWLVGNNSTLHILKGGHLHYEWFSGGPLTIKIQTSQAQVQYRSEISGLCTRKTHAQFLCKCVLKNTCFGTRLRASDAHFSFCYSLSSMAFFSSFSQQKARPKAVPTNTGKNISADKQTADKFWPCAWCWCTVATH